MSVEGYESQEYFQIKRFPTETQKALEQQGKKIYTFTGRSINDSRQIGRRIVLPFSSGSPTGFEELPSLRSEIAIDPKSPFLLNSNNKTLEYQRQMVADYFQELVRRDTRLRGAAAIIGGVSDYVELFYSTEGLMFEEKNLNKVIMTQTISIPAKNGPGHYMTVAYYATLIYVQSEELFVSGWHGETGHEQIWVIPLIVPDNR